MLTFLNLIILILVVQVIHFAGTWKLYKKAGQPAWSAAVPIYNAVVLTKIMKRPNWWVILLFIPVINLIMFPVFWVETIRSFGKNSKLDTALVVLTLGLYIYYLNYFDKSEYLGTRELKAQNKAGETLSSVLFAIVAATIVHTYIMQPFTIPTSSLEKTLLVGDFLFVSKFHYGAKTPQTPVALPMVHDSIPLTGVKSYVSSIQLPYFRLPGFQEIKRNDIVVFNWPTDTVRMFRDKSGKHYHKPIDKKSNYVKRAVGVAGDSLKIENGVIYINEKPEQLPERADIQYSYKVQGKGKGFDRYELYSIYNITDGVGIANREQKIYQFQAISENTLEDFKYHPNVASAEPIIMKKGYKDEAIFPNNGKVNWNRDQMGSIYIPKEGDVIPMNEKNFSIYRRLIEVYEGEEMGAQQELSFANGKVLLNGKEITEYTIKQNYYWMMGDNRHNSEDSRFWGFVPETHIVGKPVFVWMSWDSNASGFNKVRWNRLFTTVGGDGEPVSYFPYFLMLVVLGLGYRLFKKRKEA